NVGSAPLNDSIVVTTADDTPKTLTVSINGANDAAVINGTAAASVVENSSATVGGTLTATDVDNAATFVAQSNVARSYGKFSITTAGVWSYVLDNPYTTLFPSNVGSAPLNDSIVVTTADGTPKTVTVTINGAND